LALAKNGNDISNRTHNGDFVPASFEVARGEYILPRQHIDLPLTKRIPMQEPKRSSLDIFSRPSFHQRHDVTILEDGERSNPVVLGWGKEREGKASFGKRLIEGAVDVEFGKERLEDVAIEGCTGGEQDLTVRGPRNIFKPPPSLMDRQPADRVVDHAAW
jgi:hypothetical protein